MDQRQLLDQIGMLDAAGIRQVAAGLREESESAAGELAWWRATLAVEREIRRVHALPVAGMVAHRAAAAVTDQATHVGLALPDPDVTAVARAAAEAARALVAGGRAADNVLALLPACWPHSPQWRWPAA